MTHTTNKAFAAVNSALRAHYRSLEQGWVVVDRSGDYAKLVVPIGNSDEPFHRWFRMKEAYSFALFDRLLKDAGCEPKGALEVLDPFGGSGTTALSALDASQRLDLGCRTVLIERNPVLRVVAQAKTAGFLRGVELASVVDRYRPRVLNEFSRQVRRWRELTTDSSTLNNTAYYPKAHTRALLALVRALRVVEDRDAVAVFQTCIAAATEPSGRLRRDGRALRFVPDRTPLHPLVAFGDAVDRCLSDLAAAAPRRTSAAVLLVDGDARRADVYTGGARFNWMVFSPPYANNIDYTEVYKTEAWILGCYENAVSMKIQRLSTIRSHTSLYFPEEYSYQETELGDKVDRLISPLLAVVPGDRYERGRRQLIAGYVDDMLQAFLALRKVVVADGHLAFVVGNSVHGTGKSRFVIAADILLAAVAELAGWKVQEVRVARLLRRRAEDMEHLRESIVVLRPM